jgi:hypothetical protein
VAPLKRAGKQERENAKAYEEAAKGKPPKSEAPPACPDGLLRRSSHTVADQGGAEVYPAVDSC